MEDNFKLAFVKECNKLSNSIYQSICRLRNFPDDAEEIDKIVQCADTIIGNAKFLEDKELETKARCLVESIKGLKDIIPRFYELCRTAYEIEELLAQKYERYSRWIPSHIPSEITLTSYR